MVLKAICAVPRPDRGWLTKTWRVMRLTAVFLLAAAIHVSAASSAQRVTLSVAHGNLVEVFQTIRQQTGFEFLCDQQLLAKAKPVNIEVRDVSVDSALAAVFRDQPLTYSILDGRIIVVKEAPLRALVSTVVAPPVEIRGRVTDSVGNPLVGASVVVKGTKLGTQTDKNGEFVLAGTDVYGSVLVSY